MNTFTQDLRHSLRVLARNPGFAVVAVLTLALGIGGCTAIFTVVNAVLLRPLPYPDSQEIVQLWQVGERGGRGQFSDPNFEDLRDQNRSLEAMAAFSDGAIVSVLGGAEPARVSVSSVGKGFFEIMGVAPLRGRAFVPEEQREGAAAAVVMSHRYWQEHLGGNPNFSEVKLRVGGTVASVVGVMPPEFNFPVDTDLWAPREFYPRNPHRTGHNWQVIARLKDGVTVQHAQQDLSAIARALKEQYDDIWMKDVVVLPLIEQQTERVQTALWVLLGAVFTLLLIACANVANLLLAHVTSRQREIAVRAAMGAGRGRLVRQFLTESLALALGGAALGTLVASWGVDAMVALGGEKIPRAAEIRMDGVVLLFALGISALVAVSLSVVPALRLSGANLQELLREGGRSNTGGAGQRRLRHSFVVAQVALTLVLLVGAGLLGKSFLQLLAVDTGFRTESVVQMQIASPYPGDDAGAAVRLAEFHRHLMERLETIPGVDAVGGIDQFPLTGFMRDGMFLKIRGDEPEDIEQLFALARRDPTRTGTALFRTASEGYFRAMNIPLLRGRLFNDGDGYDAPHTAVISESLAAKEWPDQDPIGRHVQFGNMDGDLRVFTIVGIVGDVRDSGADREPKPMFYGNYAQRARNTSNFNIVMHGNAPAAIVISAARSMLRELAPEMPPRFRTMEEIFSAWLADRSFNLALVGVFGGTALLLAMMGVYGVMSYAVVQRTQEIGIRMALGAMGGDVVRQFLREGGKLIAMGVVLGLAGAAALGKYVASLLYNTSARDPLTFAAVGATMALVALLACFIPARRATRVDPMIALRHE